MITKEMKEELVAKYGLKEGDTGSPEVQVAILTTTLTSISSLIQMTIIQEEVFLRW